MRPEKVSFDVAEHLEFAPILWRPSSNAERLAALVGYSTGDGSITTGRSSYTKQTGEVSVYERFQGAFYSNIAGDLSDILSDCQALGMSENASVRPKKGVTLGFQVQVGADACRRLMDAGAPLGKKTTLIFEAPEWIRSGSLGIKRAYLAALFGAEGAAPAKDKSSKSRMPRQPVLNMCKISPAAADVFFEQLRQMLADLGVASTVTCTGDSYRTYWLRVDAGVDNLILFFETVGYVYCVGKATLAWQWAKYLRAYRAEASRRRETALRLRDEGETYEQIGREIGLTRGAAHRLLMSIDAGAETTAGQGFAHFDAWLAQRWLPELGLLRLEVVSRGFRLEPVRVWNMLVDSPDHSYLLASGVNNFNSFETMSGRVYHTFDRKLHVGEYRFNPRLPIWIGQDFNIDPMSSVVMQPQENGEIWVVDELVMFGSNTQETADELSKRYFKQMMKKGQIVFYPDPAGATRSTKGRGESDLDILRDSGFKLMKFRRKHPAIADRVNAVNRMFKSANGLVRMRVDQNAKHTIKALEETIYKPGTREVDKTAGVEHPADALGYCIDIEFPVRKIVIAGVSI